jgi:phage-related protein
VNLGDLSKDEFERLEASDGKRSVLDLEEAEDGEDDDDTPSHASVSQMVERIANEGKSGGEHSASTGIP